MMTIGKTASVAAAIMVGYSLPYCPCIFARPADSVVVFAFVHTIIGHIRSLNANTAVKMLRETMELLVRGIMICRNRPGADLKNCLSYKDKEILSGQNRDYI